MDEFEQNLERIGAFRQKSKQDEIARANQDAADKAELLKREAEMETARRQAIKEKRKEKRRGEIALCTDFHQKNLEPILEAINKNVASGGGVISVFPGDPEELSAYQVPLASMLTWKEERDEHIFGFRVGSLGTGSFTTTVFAGEHMGRSRYDQSFVVENNNLAQIKAYILSLLSISEKTRVIVERPGFMGSTVEPKGLDPT